MSRSNFTVEDFVLDPEFRSWVLKPDSKSNQFWDEFLSKHPHQIKPIKAAKEIIINLNINTYSINSDEVDELWDKIENEAYKPVSKQAVTIPISRESIIKKSEYIHKSNANKWLWLRVVAILIAGIFFSYLYVVFSNQEDILPTSELITKVNEKGVKSQVRLPDGTKVILNANSELSYEKGLSGPNRVVYLKGEAYFDVVKNPEKPFLINSDDIVTRVLGTSFNMKSELNGDVSVSLVSGRVTISNKNSPNDSVYLDPGQELLYISAKNEYSKKTFDSEKVLAWTKGIIIFDNEKIEQAFDYLESWFGVEIQILGDLPQGLTISGKYENEALDNILEGMSYTARFDYKIDHDKVTINFNTQK